MAKLSTYPDVAAPADTSQIPVVDAGATKTVQLVNLRAPLVPKSIVTALGDLIYATASATLARLAGNITTTRKFLRQVGNGAASAAPAWDTLQAGDIPAVTEAMQSLADNTTCNVSSSAHGYTPKSPADATKFLNGAATPVFAAVADSDLATTDITTNNATVTKHGFLPKLSGLATQFLNGLGNFAVPPGGLGTPGYDSGWFAITLGATYTKAHGLGAIPTLVIVEYGASATPTTIYPVIVGVDATSLCPGEYNYDATNVYLTIASNYSVWSTRIGATTGYMRIRAWL